MVKRNMKWDISIILKTWWVTTLRVNNSIADCSEKKWPWLITDATWVWKYDSMWLNRLESEACKGKLVQDLEWHVYHNEAEQWFGWGLWETLKIEPAPWWLPFPEYDFRTGRQKKKWKWKILCVSGTYSYPCKHTYPGLSEPYQNPNSQPARTTLITIRFPRPHPLTSSHANPAPWLQSQIILYHHLRVHKMPAEFEPTSSWYSHRFTVWSPRSCE